MSSMNDGGPRYFCKFSMHYDCGDVRDVARMFRAEMAIPTQIDIYDRKTDTHYAYDVEGDELIEYRPVPLRR